MTARLFIYSCTLAIASIVVTNVWATGGPKTPIQAFNQLRNNGDNAVRPGAYVVPTNSVRKATNGIKQFCAPTLQMQAIKWGQTPTNVISPAQKIQTHNHVNTIPPSVAPPKSLLARLFAPILNIFKIDD